MIGGGGAYHLTYRNIHFPKNGSSLKGGLGVEFNKFENIGFFAEINIAASFPEGSETVILPTTDTACYSVTLFGT